MKKIFYFLILLFITSCLKNQTDTISFESMINSKESTSFNNSFFTGTYSVTINNAGEYITGYGNGINFGNDFLYPSSIPAGQHGKPFAPVISSFNAYNLISYFVHGAHFTMQIADGSFSPNTTYWNALSTYNSHFAEFVDGLRAYMPEFSSYYSGSVINTTGTFVYQTGSPTNLGVRSVYVIPEISSINKDRIYILE